MAWPTGSRPGRAVTIRTMASSSPALSRVGQFGYGRALVPSAFQFGQLRIESHLGEQPR